jgi:hypothetical protein
MMFAKKKTMMGLTSAIALAAVVGVFASQSVTNEPALAASNTYTHTFSGSGVVTKKTAYTDVSPLTYESNYGQYALSGHNAIEIVAVEADTAKQGTVYFPAAFLVAASVGSASLNSSDHPYESTVGLIVGFQNVTAFSVTVLRSDTYNFNSFYVSYYDSSFNSLGSNTGSTSGESVSGGFAETTLTGTLPTSGVVRWVRIWYTVNAKNAGSSGVSGAVIESFTASWSC